MHLEKRHNAEKVFAVGFSICPTHLLSRQSRPLRRRRNQRMPALGGPSIRTQSWAYKGIDRHVSKVIERVANTTGHTNYTKQWLLLAESSKVNTGCPCQVRMEKWDMLENNKTRKMTCSGNSTAVHLCQLHSHLRKLVATSCWKWKSRKCEHRGEYI